MPEGRKRLTGATKGLLDAKQDKPRLYPALLGAYVDGVKQIRVGSRQDFVWCRMRGSSTEVIQAMNDSVGLHWDLPILVYRDPLAPGMWKVYGRDIRQYSDWEGASYLPPHADAHSFAGSNNTGIDPVWVFKRQYMPMLPRPVASGTLSIYIEADFWTYGGRYYWWPGSGTTSLASYRPTGALNGAFVTVYMDGAKKIPQYIKSEEFAAWYPPSDPTDFISLPTPSQGVALAAVFLTTGTEWIGWGEIYDLRQPAEPLFDELATGSVVIRDEGTVLGSATTLNFVGPGVVASMSGSYCQVTVPGPGVDQIGIWGWDDGIPVGTGTILNATYGIDLTRSGSVLDIQAEPPITGSVVIYDENLLLGSVLGLNFAGANVQAIISGTVAHIMVTGTAGGGGGGGSGSVVILDESVVLGSALRLNFLGAGVTVVMNGDDAEITIPGGGGGAGASSGICRRIYVDLASEVSGDYYIVPNPPYVSGSLGVAIGGLVQRPSIDYDEQYAESGTFNYLATPPTGVFHVVWYERDEWCASSIPMPTTGSIVIQDEGVTLGSVTELNFVGPNVDASIVGTTGRIFVTGSVGGGGGDPPITGSFVGMDEDAVLGSALAINFLGAGVTAVMDGTVLDVTIPGGADPPITGSVVVDDEGVVQGSAVELDFVGAGVTAAVAAGRATITIPGGGSSAGPSVTGTCLLFDYLASRDGEKAAVLVELPTGTLYQDLHYVVKLRTNRAANVLEGLRYYFGFGAAGAISGANQYTNWSDEEGNSDSEQRSANDAIGWIGRFSIAGATANTGTYGVGHGYIPDFQNPVGFKHNQGDIISFGDVTGSYRHSHYLSTCEVGGVLRRILFVSANASNFIGESSIRVYGMGCPDHYGGDLPTTGSVVAYEDSALLGSVAGIDASHGINAIKTGTVAHLELVDCSPMLKHKKASDTPDDEFIGGVLDPKWTASKASAGTVAFLSGSAATYDLATRNGNLLIQLGNGQQAYFRQDYTLPDAKSVVLAITPAASLASEGVYANNSAWLGLALNNNDNGPLTGTYTAIFYDAQADGGRILSYQNGTTIAATQAAAGAPQSQGIIASKNYLRIVRQGVVYHFFCSNDGSAWYALSSYTGTVALDNLWVFCECRAAPSIPLPIHAVHWVRQGGNGLDPW